MRHPENTLFYRIQTQLLSLFFLLPMVFFSISCSKNESNEPEKSPSFLKSGVETGNLAPNFLIKNLRGGETTLSEYKGKVVLVNFWATWCGPCKAEMPSMEKLYQTYPRKDFEILAISIDIGEDAPVKEFIEDHHLSFPVLLDNELEVNNLYQVRVVPTSILVNRKGVISHRLLGAKEWSDPKSVQFVENLIETGT